MANQRLYLMQEVENPTRLGNSMSTEYSFWGGKLRIYWKGSLLHEQPAQMGDGFFVNCDGGHLEMRPLKLPRRPEQFVLWLVGIPRPLRATCRKDYEVVAAHERQANDWWGYQEWSHEGDGWIITTCSRPDCGGIDWIGAYIDPSKFNKGVAVEILGRVSLRSGYPLQLAEAELRKRLGFTDADMAAISQNLTDWLR